MIKRKIIFYCNNVVATVPVRISTKGLCRVILGPCAPCTITLALLITSLFAVSCVISLARESHCMEVELMVLVICKTTRPNLRVCSLGFHFNLFWYHFSIYCQISFVLFKTFTDVKWRKGTETHTHTHTHTHTQNAVCSCLRVGHFHGEGKCCTWFLKSPKAPAQNSAGLVDARVKWLERISC